MHAKRTAGVLWKLRNCFLVVRSTIQILANRWGVLWCICSHFNRDTAVWFHILWDERTICCSWKLLVLHEPSAHFWLWRHRVKFCCVVRKITLLISCSGGTLAGMSGRHFTLAAIWEILICQILKLWIDFLARHLFFQMVKTLASWKLERFLAVSMGWIVSTVSSRCSSCRVSVLPHCMDTDRMKRWRSSTCVTVWCDIQTSFRWQGN